MVTGVGKEDLVDKIDRGGRAFNVEQDGLHRVNYFVTTLTTWR